MNFDYQLELDRINNMDESQILLKGRNFRRFKFMTNEQYRGLENAIRDRLRLYGYELQNACCGRYNINKLTEK